MQMPSGNGGNSTTGDGNTNSTNTGGNRNGRNRNNQRLQRSNDISQLKRQIQRLVRRLSISPSEANDLITAAGSALNVPIDLLVGLKIKAVNWPLIYSTNRLDKMTHLPTAETPRLPKMYEFQLHGI